MRIFQNLGILFRRLGIFIPGIWDFRKSGENIPGDWGFSKILGFWFRGLGIFQNLYPQGLGIFENLGFYSGDWGFSSWGLGFFIPGIWDFWKSWDREFFLDFLFPGFFGKSNELMSWLLNDSWVQQSSCLTYSPFVTCPIASTTWSELGTVILN